MLLQVIKESIKLSLRNREILVWTLIFPILLSTMFHFAFGRLDEANMLNPISVAVIEDEAYEKMPAMVELLTSLSEGEEPLLIVNSCETEEEALALLEEGEVAGCIQMKEDQPHLTVKEEGLEQTILRQVLNQYQQMAYSITAAMEQAQKTGDPMAMEAVMKALEQINMETQTTMAEHVSLTRSNPSDKLGFFYSLLGMVCLFGSFQGINAVGKLQANQSALGARRCISPRRYSIEMLGSLMGCVLVHIVAVMLTLAFLAFVLKVDFGGRLPLAAVGCIAGSLVGVAMGAFMGSFPKLSENAKTGLSITVSLVLCFFAGLMMGGMNYWVHQHIPVLSWINPAARLVDALQSLYYFDSLATFWLNSGILMAFAVLLFVVSALRLRRYQYESI